MGIQSGHRQLGCVKKQKLCKYKVKNVIISFLSLLKVTDYQQLYICCVVFFFLQEAMFLRAYEFNQDIGSWDVSNGKDFVSVATGTFVCYHVSINTSYS